MPRLTLSIVVEAPLETVWDFYNDIKTLPRITPPATLLWLPDSPEPMRKGARYVLHVLQPPVPAVLAWETVIVEYEPPHRFVDEQGTTGPFGFWHHEHRFEAIDSERTRLWDIVTYDPPYGLLGAIADRLFIDWQLRAMFHYRHRKTKEALERRR